MSAPGPAVLVVEDDETIRETVVEFLAAKGFAAEGAPNGQTALDRLAATTRRPCLIVLDLMMPVMDGRSFREAQLHDPELARIPVIVMSAHRDPTFLADELAPAQFLRKPFKLRDLLQLVRFYCDGGASNA